MIPKTNVNNLMLREEIVEAVKKKKFHIYAVSTIDEGISVLTEKSADTVFKAVRKNVKALAETAKSFGQKKEKKKAKKK